MPEQLCLSCSWASARPMPYSAICRAREHAAITRAKWERTWDSLPVLSAPMPARSEGWHGYVGRNGFA